MKYLSYLVIAFTAVWLFCEDRSGMTEKDASISADELYGKVWNPGIYFTAWRTFPKDLTDFTGSEYTDITDKRGYHTDWCINIALPNHCYLRASSIIGDNSIFSSTDVDEWYTMRMRQEYDKALHPYERHVINSDWHCDCLFTDLLWLTPSSYHAGAIFTAWTYGSSFMFMNQRCEVIAYDLYEYRLAKEQLSYSVVTADNRAFSIGGHVGFLSVFNFNKYIALRSYCQLYMTVQFIEIAYRKSDIIDQTFPLLTRTHTDFICCKPHKTIGTTIALPLEGSIDLLCYVSNLYNAVDIQISFGKSCFYLPWQLYSYDAVCRGVSWQPFVWGDRSVQSFMFEGWRLGIAVSW